MPQDASRTREKLIDEAARSFRGAWRVRRVVGREHAPPERHDDFLARRQGELLEVALTKPDDDLESVVDAIVRPATVGHRPGVTRGER